MKLYVELKWNSHVLLPIQMILLICSIWLGPMITAFILNHVYCFVFQVSMCEPSRAFKIL